VQDISLYCKRILKLLLKIIVTHISSELATFNIIVTFYLIFVCRESCLLKIL